MRSFRYLGPNTEGHDGPLKKGQIIECDTQNPTPDGGILGALWEEVDG